MNMPAVKLGQGKRRRTEESVREGHSRGYGGVHFWVLFQDNLRYWDIIEEIRGKNEGGK